ncbi:hypothetical protein [Stigmatella erecta]|uniref:SpoIIAA-like n=1 Tax=Stigmatella erecta TaxID=83460 RepID=A0A1I0L4N9_9BACT|nr:hypothetical protein [Stigmatella erecta]SEU34615.1 hypothetical protein SAMN05443639_11988 [Stigmatella erecta]
MGLNLLYASEHLDLHHADSERWLYADWKGYLSVDMVKGGCEEMLRYLTRLKLAKVLNDNSHMTGAWIGAADWLAKEWFPRMRQAGLRHFAWVPSPYPLSRLAALTALRQAVLGPAELFGTVEAAAAWLRVQPF